MKREDILSVISTLAESNSVYERIYNDLTDGSVASEMYLKIIEDMKFESVEDMCYWLFNDAD